MEVLVWNSGAIQYSLENPSVQHKVPISRDEMEARIHTIAAAPFCSYSVAPSYVRDEIAKNPLLMILMDGHESKGFIMARQQVDQGVYLDVICSAEGTGSSFLRFFLNYCEHERAAYVELSSLINVLAYYPIFGFEHRKECTPGKGANLAMSKELLDHLKTGKKEKRLQEYTNYYKDPYMMQYVMELHRHGYTKTTNPDVCKQKTLSGPRFRQYHCARDGFAMRKCFGIPVVQAGQIVAFEAMAETVPRTKKPIGSVGTMRRAKGSIKSKSKAVTKKRPAISARELASLAIPTKSKGTRRIRKSVHKM